MNSGASPAHAAYRRVLRRLPASGRAWVKAGLAVLQIVPSPVRPLEWFTMRPVRERVSFAFGQAPVLADLYAPVIAGRLPAIVMTLGANDLGERDPRAIGLADVLARSGFLTLVVIGVHAPVDSAEEDPLGIVEGPAVAAAAFEYLVTRPDADPRRIGFVGVCFGGSACLQAAARAELAQRVAFVFVIGPYLSLRDLLRATVTGLTQSERTGGYRAWSAQPWALARAREWLLSVLPRRERTLVRSALERGGLLALPDPLSAQAAAVFHLTGGVAPERADALINALGEAFVAALEQASPAGHLAGLRAETYVMHGVADGVVPVDESRRLVKALRGQVPLHYAEFELFEHVDASRPLSVATYGRELRRLMHHVRPLMQVVG